MPPRVRQRWPDGYVSAREIHAREPKLAPRSQFRREACGTYLWLHWPEPGGSVGLESLEWDLIPELDTSQGYYWAHQFWMRGSGEPKVAGYAGLQANGSYQPGPPTKVAIFSIWHALEAQGTGIARPFSGEGTGFQTLIRFPWIAGRRYHLCVRRLHAARRDWWVASVRDAESDVAVEIGRIRVPESWGALDTVSTAWTELFTPPILRCADIECASSLWSDFTANDGSIAPTSIVPRFSEPVRCENSRIALLEDGGIRQQMGSPPD